MNQKFFAVLTFSLLSAGLAQAAQQAPRGVLGTLLYNVREDDSPILRREFRTLNIDVRNHQVSMNYLQFFRCPVNAQCMPMPPRDTTVSLPIISVEADECHVVTYVAEQDKRPVDGIKQEIRIVDATQNICDYALNPDLIHVSFTRESLRGGAVVQEMTGTPFIKGGLKTSSSITELSCHRDPLIADLSLETEVLQLFGKKLNGQDVNLGRMANVSEGGFAGLMSFKYYPVTKKVSDVPGAGTSYEDKSAMYSLNLPVVAPTPSGHPAHLSVYGDDQTVENVALSCQFTR